MLVIVLLVHTYYWDCELGKTSVCRAYIPRVLGMVHFSYNYPCGLKLQFYNNPQYLRAHKNNRLCRQSTAFGIAPRYHQVLDESAWSGQGGYIYVHLFDVFDEILLPRSTALLTQSSSGCGRHIVG